MMNNEKAYAPSDREYLHYYSVHGLRVASSLELPELTPSQRGGVDVEIIEGDVPPSLGDDATRGDYWHSQGRQFLFGAPNAARFLVTEGRSIRFQPDLGQARDEHAIRVFLLGTALGALLHQRGAFPLHASGVVTPSGAWLFTGHSGAGKSTLVAWLHRRFGWPILGDDVTVITDDGGMLRAQNGVARLRLWSDALAALAISEEGLVRDLMRLDKYQLLLGAGYSRPASLRGLVVLDTCEGDASQVTRLSGHDSLATAMGSVYRPELADLWRGPGDLFLRSARVSASIQVFRFSRPLSLADHDRHLEPLIIQLEAGTTDKADDAILADTNAATTG